MKKIKRFSALPLILLLCIFMTSCGDTGAKVSEETTAEAAETEAESTELAAEAPDMELAETVHFPDDFQDAYLSYPASVAPVQHLAVKNALNFNVVNSEGTDDKYVNIMFCFLPVEGYDDYLAKGYGAAKPYMAHMLETFLKTLQGKYLTKSITSDYIDGRDHYSITGYTWLKSNIFDENLQEPVRGRMVIRYYGPIGYVLVASTNAVESRYKDYCDVTDRMLDSLFFTTGWSTSPKAVPGEPAPKEGTATIPAKKRSAAAAGAAGAAAQSDPGDYGSAYYWYDSDGDIWYWDGYENQFVGFGSDGYIDDGEYFESNDAGWDSRFYNDSYDPWSDSGDAYEYEEYEFNDYDPNSDPGDYGDEYSWTDQDGDVWYFNGFEDEYVGSGEDYYVEDGQYYENNDDGWAVEYEPEYNDYEPEYNDYDPYSDAGDYGDYEDYGGYEDYGDYGDYGDW